MIEQGKNGNCSEQNESDITVKKVHQTHFGVQVDKLPDKGRKSDFEWVDLGNGRWKLVRKKAKD